MTNYSNRKYSLSALFLMLLLVIRFIGQIFGIYLFSPITALIILFSILALLYLVSFIGVLMKTKWGLDIALAVTVLDIIAGLLSMVFTLNVGISTVFSLIIDLVLFSLVININRRIGKIHN